MITDIIILRFLNLLNIHKDKMNFLSCYKKSRKIYFAPFNPAFIFEVHSTKLDNLSFIRHCKKDDIEFIEPSI